MFITAKQAFIKRIYSNFSDHQKKFVDYVTEEMSTGSCIRGDKVSDLFRPIMFTPWVNYFHYRTIKENNSYIEEVLACCDFLRKIGYVVTLEMHEPDIFISEIDCKSQVGIRVPSMISVSFCFEKLVDL